MKDDNNLIGTTHSLQLPITAKDKYAGVRESEPLHKFASEFGDRSSIEPIQVIKKR